MSVETEKKYRIDKGFHEVLIERLEAAGANFKYERFEENYLHRGGVLDRRNAVLRIRKLEDRAILAYKEKAGFDDGVKRQIEYETEISDVAAMEAIIEKLGYHLSVVYEKRRKAWDLVGCEVVLDELPFGWFMEIEGSEEAIAAAEKLLDVEDLEAESGGYPSLTLRFGKDVKGVREARF